MSETSGFLKISLQELGLKQGDVSPFDLYVFLHASGRHHAILKGGDQILETHWANLLRLQDANLFVKDDEPYRHWKSQRHLDASQVLATLPKPFFRADVLGEQAKLKLRELYQKLVISPQAGKEITETLGNLSESLLDALVPETRDAKSAILQQLRHLSLMNQAAAISSLAMLTALANGFESRTAFSNLAFACLLMDAGLVDVAEKDLATYHRNRSELPAHVMDRIRLHPVKSVQMIHGMKEANDAIEQLVLLHHELHNGKGYHRGLRTGSASPLARNLSFAVDLYEQIKGAESRGEKISIGQAIAKLAEKGVDAQDRRHGTEISAKLIEYLNLKI